ncbi:MAG TPA: hypothetical protein VN999_16105 [Thermoanaerobaculia bacterium]|nr:hypothetical protein [Thermoanaerobaculia bacterium]
MASKIKMASFDQGQIPTIAVINQATVDLGVDLDALIAALQKFVDQDFAPIWGTPAKLKKSNDFIPGAWAIAFIDNADVQGVLGYHELTPDGLPLSKVFVETTIEANQQVSVTACHELAEMLVDPAVNLWSEAPDGTLYAYEMSDAVEEEEFEIDGIAMSDFVYPAYFEGFRAAGSTQFDFLKKINSPFQILSGGYSLVRNGGTVTQVFGSLAKEKRFRKEDRRSHRSEYRKPTGPLIRSAPSARRRV